MDDLNPEQLSSLDKFKRRLERRGGSQSDFKSTLLPPKNFNVDKKWGDDEAVAVDFEPAVAKKTGAFLWRLFWVTALFFGATLAVAIYVLFFSANIVSGNNIDILIKGQAQIRSGDELNLQTTIVNKNKVTLSSVDLVFTYPSGTMNPLSPNSELPIWREKIADLSPGQTVDIANRAIIFGAQNTTREVKVVLEYHIPDSNALFTKEKTYPVLIGSSSLDLSLQLPTEVNLGKEFTGTLKVVSNAQSLLRNCAIKFEWPTGFNLKTALPTPVVGNNSTWFLGDLVPGTEKYINFTGTLNGQSGDVKSFKATAGFASGEGRDPITLEYGNLFQTINLRKDLISADILVADENGQDRAIFPGGSLTGNIGWLNNLSDKIIDGSFVLELSGTLINKKTIHANDGFYDSTTNTISWDERTLADLKAIAPDDGGQAEFGFNLLPFAIGASSEIKEINLKLTFHGTRLTGDNQTEDVVTESSKTIKVSTLTKLKADSVYQTGPFKNTGPLPPKVGQETSYTINWTVTNTLNNLDNVTVKTVLPPSVKWLGAVSPLDEKIVYNQTSGEVVWTLGTVQAGTGDTSPARQASFQISLLPSLSQAGVVANLTGQTTLNGKDTFTGAKINQSASPATTRLSSDPGFGKGQEIISE